MNFRFPLTLAAAFLAALQLAIMPSAAQAQAERLVWSFSEANDPANRGRATARLVYGIPETDASKVAGVCEARSSTGVNLVNLILGADIGTLENGAEVKLRFSGGGFDRALPGSVIGVGAETGITGVVLDVPNDDPLWQALAEKDSLDYLVPGYRAAKLDLRGGHQNIKDFIAACRGYAEALAPKPAAQAPQAPAEPKSGNARKQGISEEDAFAAAKELGTIEAWEAFLTRFSSSFRADLARAYVKRIGREAGADSKPAQTAAAPAAPAAAQPPPAPADEPELALLNLGPGTAPWSNGTTVVGAIGNQSVYAAGVQSNGVELVTYCRDWNKTGGTGHGLFAVLRQSPGAQYPDFKARLRQAMAKAEALQGGRRVQLSFSNGKTFDRITLQGDPASGEVLVNDGGQAISQGLAFGEILGASTMTLLAPPFAATFQLSNSRAAICDVFKRCGAPTRPECAKYAPRSASTSSTPAQPKTSKRERRKKEAGERKSRCGSGSVWLEGKCIKRSEVVEFCGPGYKRRGSKCVSRYEDQARD